MLTPPEEHGSVICIPAWVGARSTRIQAWWLGVRKPSQTSTWFDWHFLHIVTQEARKKSAKHRHLCYRTDKITQQQF